MADQINPAAPRVGFLDQYCRGKIFLFMPNVCDAECAFCYVKPSRVDFARISAGVMQRAVALMKALYSRGLREVRITGGEPLVFENLEDLVAGLQEASLAYTVLTNGINLPKAVPWLLRRRPSKITVSVHSLSRVEEVYQRPVVIGDTIEAMSDLVAADIPVSASIVCLPEILPEIQETLSRLHHAGIRDYKLIHPNDDRYTVTGADFRTIAASARMTLPQNSRLRFSDTAETACLLTRQGELSVSLPRFEWSWCCATVGSDSLGTATSLGEFDPIARSLMERVRRITDLPCHNQGFCPIALTEPEK
ncbi:radical SAM protein [Micromonospora avicenniae]|uniref:radical SAM protein n=1 Tax=Micromonospora avicenniae TaxID=1198245 RepID=UPI003432A37C